MLKIHLCGEDQVQVNIVKKYIEEIISLENFDMNIFCVTKYPSRLLECISRSENSGLCFLGSSFKSSNLTGIDLARIIKKKNPNYFIVFITKYDEKSIFLFKNFDAEYILKEETTKIKKKVHEYMIRVNKKYQQSIPEYKKVFTFKVEDREIKIHYKYILSIRTSKKPHKLILHTINNERYEFNGQLKDIMNQLDSRFYMCHESCVVNKEHIKDNGVDFENNIIYLTTGDTCPLSVRRRKGLERYRKDNKKQI